MAAGKTFTCDLDPTIDGLALTYIVPAARCGLHCSFCIIKQRDEAGPVLLQPEHYASFIRDVSDYVPVRVSGLQGYEPLVEDAWPYTRAILNASNRSFVPTSMVTNGLFLAERIDELMSLDLKDLTVSLDSADSDVHDRQRGVAGSFKRTVAGLRAAVSKPSLSERVVVAAVLLPKRRRQLDTMPRFLADLGVRYFGVTPLIRIGREQSGRMIQDNEALMRDLDHLQIRCDDVGIQFVVDDELKQFRHLTNGANRFMIHSLERPGRLIRLTPSGACSVGLEVLRPVTAATPVWDPHTERPRDFLDRLSITPELFPISSSGGQQCEAA